MGITAIGQAILALCWFKDEQESSQTVIFRLFEFPNNAENDIAVDHSQTLYSHTVAKYLLN